ncbi:MAG: hypothetical protein NTY38_03545 [Acidobacteria bacterium]|nr:hypothetical protein [Acidobacteriota bacterium]
MKQRSRIRFPLDNGMECIITEQGICQIPALQAPPQFQFDELFAKVTAFFIESPDGKDRTTSRKLSRTELESLTAGGELAVHVDHDE